VPVVFAAVDASRRYFENDGQEENQCAFPQRFV